MTTQSSDTAPTPEAAADTSRKPVWLRGFCMIIIAFLIGAAQSVLVLLALIQFLLMLISRGEPNAQIADFGETVGKWLAQASKFLTAKSEDKPWPLGPLT